MQVFLARHKISGLYFPDPKGRNGRGGSHTEPSVNIDGDVRIFRTARSAKLFIGQWVLGKFICHRYGQDEWYDEEVSIVPVPSRSKDDIEIVTCEVIPT